MKDNDSWKRIHARLVELRREWKRSDKRSRPYAIRLLRRLVNSTHDDKVRANLLTLMAVEYSWYGLIAEEEQTLIEITNILPDDPLPWVSLASYYLIEKEDLEKAMSIIETAIEKARRTGYFLRHAYTTKARIASKLRDYHQLEKVLELLANYQPPDGSMDIGYEQDFLQNLPPEAVNQEILERYKATAKTGKTE